MRASIATAALAALASLGAGPPAAPRGATPATTLIRGALVVDGTGAPGRVASVRLAGGRIAAVGALAPEPGEEVVEASGLVLAPGFIDTHSHHERDEDLASPAAVSQGITTIVVGQDGGSPFPLADFFAGLEAEPRAVNVASYAGHGTLRERVMGEDFRRAASEAEIEAMRALLRLELAAGALGLSSGLEYDPGIYSTTEELVSLAREAAAAGGRYISHVRSEDRRFEEALAEIVRIGREAALPVQISHFKLARRGLWGQAPQILAMLEEARASGVEVTADIYPYEHWQSTLTVLFPERDFTDREEATYALSEVATPPDILITEYEPDPELVGRTLAQVASARGADPETTLMELIAASLAAGGDNESIIGRSMREEDVAALLAWPHTNVCSDGSGGSGHPRGWGAFPKVLRRYVRELRVLTLEEAVHRMTALAAAHVGLAGRGTLREGAPGDLVLFDPETVGDRATFEEPSAPSAAIVMVWVNGVAVLRDGRVTGERPGQVLRRAG